MSDILERRYRYLLRTYPPAHRARRHDEILTTLMEAARPGQRFPAAREAASLFLSGLRVRLGPANRADSKTLWLDGLRIGALLLLVSLTSKTAWAAFEWNRVGSPGWHRFAWVLPIALLTGLALVATARGAYRIALGLTVAGASAAQWVAGLGPPGEVILAALARARWEHLLVPLLLIMLIGQPAPARVRVWPWLAVLVLAFGSAGWHSYYPLRFWGTIALLLATTLWATIDPRVPVAAAFLLLPIVLDQAYLTAYPLISAATYGTGIGDPGLFLANGLYLAALAAGTAVLLGVSRRRIRRHGQM